MSPDRPKFVAKVPKLDLDENREMLTEFIGEAHKHLLNAKNSLLVLETVPDDREAIENIFKSFHTIKGLADFLNLEDLCSLTEAAETIFDMVRKNIIIFQGSIADAAKEAIDNLYKLIELLNEQILNNGQLKSPYHDVGSLMQNIQNIIDRVDSDKDSDAEQLEIKREIPSITIDESETAEYATLKEKLQSDNKEILVDRKSLEVLLADLTRMRNELKEAQSKIHENQRELVKERELAIKLTQQAQSMARIKSEFLASMAHEIRTLINAILGFTDLLKRSPLNPKQKEQLDTIVMSGNLLLGIVNDILDFSKVEAGKLKLESIDFNLGALVDDVFKIMRTRLKNKAITLYFEIDKNVPMSLKGDPTRLKQIFINLLDNALKFTEQGEVGLLIKLNEGHTRFDKQYKIQFTVSDTGIGIPDDRKDLIFESFTQADNTITRKYGGSGLGLTLCRNYVENMGGKMWIDSKVGQGSQFSFTASLTAGAQTAKRPVSATAKVIADKKVCIVAENDHTIKALQGVCEAFKADVESTLKKVEEVNEHLKNQLKKKKRLPDVIFIDTVMPNKRGFILASKIRQNSDYDSIKLIGVNSTLGAEEESQHSNNFNEFLSKPIIMDEFVTAFAEAFSDTKVQQSGAARSSLEDISCEGIKILVVEDSIPNQELLKAHFESLGCEVDYAFNGQEAIEMMKQNEYDICFMDLQMPIMGGIEATQIIRQELKKQLPIVALTAAEVQEEKAKCINAGMNDYLPKPFSLFQLKEKIISSTKM